ncbi:1,2-dihydroxy-3-keto-5-methylthiopentene dioxygenase [Dickeya dianthicola]|uniref:1,2-dihydroxy-3-keto-5-methylthiopentene dioxygenase n=1 Tax=Dickeya dianthicola TaxID=204039 RepID=UPI0003A8D6C1|nr:acireductone dioxygenase [Dickeya dianthicola]MCI4028998.1 acireductone dioxygenase [Dickeya dianthicola]MCI4173629.1 acireductone dioxygenase [Dickeya dianthicola]MCI4178912.1 acireductone dioxygenase [Dickeya dianthicola]MCI4184122.1 acireductone dioxygenase [Dickeya dianthicola]MCI4196301.1 acireductone dioxygenase [Dickeya dianthicola]
MSALTIFSDTDARQPVWQSREADAIAQQLSAIHVRFERWQADRDLSATPSAEEVLAAYQHEVDKLVAEKGYQSWDVVSMRADNPQKAALRTKFLSEHTHAEDEVRFFVEGAGLFCLHVDGRIFQILCEKNDLLSVPAGIQHWFDMGSAPHFTAIRLFNNPDGWIAHFTGDAIADVYPKLA